MTRKLKYGIFALLLGWSCTEIAAQPRLPEVDPKVKEDPMFQLQKLNQFYRYLNGTYVDTLHNDQLVERPYKPCCCNSTPTLHTSRKRR